ncbi:uncharacterized protein CTHT_0013960 [Thermochaetoides thermophila DSM 1495]|uniref:Protein Asterix n=1 Tax=Chaetomium thermophilum (strain DSM 1495 / CBS 144.50 / IMI 039719) TaxID=759272 RepID=G0S1K8_CHATD|nr:hypothetical protein CTHT_0013960 [Thermochaetoides thermophila DSM 1495]EGS22918.1 hypothetical protein CTHT_0013960 [Thermochaetoides thermophila DSM 1495]
MATRKDKDMRRPDLVVPYMEPALKNDNVEFQSTLASTLPMAAVFMRNRFLGWAAVVFAVQSWLGESEEMKRSTATPGYFSVGMSIMSLIVTYLPIFLPPPPGQAGAAAQAAAATTAAPAS